MPRSVLEPMSLDLPTGPGVYLFKNKKGKARSTQEQPRGDIWENELMDSDEYEELQKALKLTEADPENRRGRLARARPRLARASRARPPSMRTKWTEYDI